MDTSRGPFWAALAAAAIGSAQVTLPLTYHDSRAALTIHYPAGWSLAEDWPPFTIDSFPPSKRPRLVLVPANEAQITIGSERTDSHRGVYSVRDWLRANRITVDRGFRITDTRLMVDSFGEVPAVRAEKDLEPQFPMGVSVDYAFTLGDRLYDVRIFYRGYARAKEFEDVLLTIIRRLEPDQPIRQ